MEILLKHQMKAKKKLLSCLGSHGRVEEVHTAAVTPISRGEYSMHGIYIKIISPTLHEQESPPCRIITTTRIIHAHNFEYVN
jgi:hypothetical protein